MIDLVLIVFLTTVSYVLFRFFFEDEKTKLINKIPGPRAYPLLGNLVDVMESTDVIISNARERQKIYGPIIRIWLGPIPVVGVHSAEYVEVILSSNKEITKSFAYNLVEPWLGKGLLTSDGGKWAKHRKLITPTFHFTILDSFVPIYESQSQTMVRKLSGAADSGEPFDLYPYITLCALDIITETAMGINFKAQDSLTSDYINAIYSLSKLVVERISRVYLHPNWIYAFTPSGREHARCIKVLHEFSNRVISERKKYWRNAGAEENASEDGVKKKKAFLDLLIASGSDLSDDDIREEVDTFMFEGHDTTTAGISWAIFLLGHHPTIQDQVAEEVRDLWPEGTPLTMQILNQMKLLERVIKEALRLYPSVPFISRTLAEDMKFGEYLVPAQTTVSVSKALLHRDPKVFANPDKFDPDRFLPENILNRHPFAYVPFSAGPRNCIGQKFAILEEKAILASFFRSYKVESLEKEEDVVVVTQLIQRPRDGIKVRLTRRT